MAAQSGVSEAVVEATSGALGSVLATVATYPLKTIYTLQALSSGSSGTGDAVQALSALEIIKRYKLQGLFVGVEPNIVESALSSGVYFYLYSKLRHWVITNSQKNKAPEDAGSSRGKSMGALSSLLVASLAGVGNQLVTMPASVVSTRMQAQKKAYMDAKAAGTADPNSRSPTIMDIIRGVHAESGLGGFWAGLLPSMVLVSNPAIQYMLFEQLQRALRAYKAKRQAQEVAAAQALARAVSVSGGAKPSFPAPANPAIPAQARARAEAAAVPPRVSSFARTPSSGNAAEAKTPEAAAAAPSEVDAAAQKLAAALPPVTLRPWEIFTISALSKIGATIATYWLVVVKSRLQAAGKNTDPSLQYNGTMDALIRIWKEEGFGGYFKGLRAKILQTALNAALMLMLKEQLYSTTKACLNSQRLRTIMTAVVTA